MRSFARHPFYTERNERLVEMIPGLDYAEVVYEFGSGEGAVTELILQRTHQTVRVYAVEPSAAQIKAAAKRLKAQGDRFVQLIRAKAEGAGAYLKELADVAIMCNCIHLIKDKAGVILSIFRFLEEEGQLGLNTAFYEGSEPDNEWPAFVGCRPPESLQFYRRWMAKALRSLVEQGLRPRKEKTQARRQLSAADYLKLVEASGFAVVAMKEETAEIPLAGWIDISKYELFARGAFPGVPVNAASEVLQRAAAETFQELGLSSVPRNWLSIVAQKAA